jgi:methionine sulfoxide reductase heme-binding subunit
MNEKFIRGAVFLLCALPFAGLLYAAGAGALGPDPAEQVMHVTGEWSLRLLILTLLVSPLRAWTGWSVLLRMRRMLGLYTFFYASLHLVAFLQLFTGWEARTFLLEVVDRPYVTLGMAAWALFLPLAVTSTRRFQRRLGRNWARLHRLVYLAAVLACLHLVWLARSDVGEALVHSIIVAALLLWRLRRMQLRKVALNAA